MRVEVPAKQKPMYSKLTKPKIQNNCLSPNLVSPGPSDLGSPCNTQELSSAVRSMTGPALTRALFFLFVPAAGATGGTDEDEAAMPVRTLVFVAASLTVKMNC